MKQLTLTLLALATYIAAWAQEIPAYYHEGGYIEQKIEKIKEQIKESGNKVTFPYLTDGHWRDNGKQSFPLIDYIRKQVKMPFSFCLGVASMNSPHSKSIISSPSAQKSRQWRRRSTMCR